jgi:hypothetical protein
MCIYLRSTRPFANMYIRVLSLSHSSRLLALSRIPRSKLCYLKDKDALDFTFSARKIVEGVKERKQLVKSEPTK